MRKTILISLIFVVIISMFGICNKKTNKALFRIYMDSYSEHGQTEINKWLNIIQ